MIELRFVSREYELSVAMMAKDKVVESFHEGVEFSQRGLAFYGQGGCGKSTLRREISNKAKEDGEAYVIQCDFDDNADPYAVLPMIAGALGRLGCECSTFWDSYDQFSQLSPGYGAYAERLRPGKRDSLKDIRSLLPEWLDLPLSISCGIADALRRAEERSFADGWNAVMRDSEFSINALTAHLAFDFELWMREKAQRPVLFFLDTYERITGVEKGDYCKERDEWLEPMLAAYGSFWFIFGRGEVRNDLGITSEEVGIFSYAETKLMMEFAGIRDVDDDLLGAVFEASRGLPLFVAVFVEAYRCALEQEGCIRPDEIETAESLTDVFLKYFTREDTDSMEVICTCACLGRWDVDVICEVDKATKYRTTALHRVESLSFVDVRDQGVAYMHEVAAKAIRLMPCFEKKRELVERCINDLAGNVGESLASEGWNGRGWWGSAELLCQLRRQAVVLSSDRGNDRYVEERRLSLAAALTGIGLNKEAASIEGEIMRARANAGDVEGALRAERALGVSFEKAGMYGLAKRHYEHVLTEWMKVDGSNRVRIAEAIMSLGVAKSYLAQENNDPSLHEEALADKQIAVDSLSKLVAEESVEECVSMLRIAKRNLAVTLWDVGRVEDALQIERDLAKEYVRKCGLHNPDTLTALDNMAGSVFEIGKSGNDERQIGKALRIHERVLDLRRECLPENHVDAAISHYNIADTYLELGQIDEAACHAEKALEIYFRVYEGHHSNVEDAADLLRKVDAAREKSE